MRDYCRVYHASPDRLAVMPMGRLMEELADAAGDLAEEQRERERQAKRLQAQRRAARHRR